MPGKLLKTSSSSQNTRYKDQPLGSDPAHRFYLKVLNHYQAPTLQKGTKLTPKSKHLFLNPVEGADLRGVNYVSL